MFIRKIRLCGVALTCAVAAVAVSAGGASAAGKPATTGANSCTKIADAFTAGTADSDFTFYETTFDITVGNPERVVIATSCDGTGAFIVDDGLEMTVDKHGGGGSVSETWHGTCNGLQPASGPIDVTDAFSPGRNTVHFRLFDICGYNITNPDLYLVVQQHA